MSKDDKKQPKHKTAHMRDAKAADEGPQHGDDEVLIEIEAYRPATAETESRASAEEVGAASAGGDDGSASASTTTTDKKDPETAPGAAPEVGPGPAVEPLEMSAAAKGRIRMPALLKNARIFLAKHGEAAVDADGAPVPTYHAPEDVPISDGRIDTSKDTRDILRSLKRQQDLRLRADIAEAQDLERRAKDLSKQVKIQKKLRREVSKHYEYVQDIAAELGFDPDRPVTTIPEITDPDVREVQRLTIQEGIVYVRVLFRESKARYEYEVIEPTLSKTEEEVLAFVRDTLIRTMDGRAGSSKEDGEAQLLAAIERVIVDHSILIDDVARRKIQFYIIRDFLGYGPVDVLMRDPMVEDISCDGPGVPIFLFHREYESLRTNVVFEDELALDSYVIRLGQRSGKHISIADPLLDATLPDKSRLQATLAKEITTRGSSFTIRRFRADPLTPADLVRLKTWSPAMAAYFWFAMQEGNSILYAGGTASGKTTSLNAMGIFIPPEKKIVSIEDTREINLPHDNWIAGVTRSGFGSENASGKRSGEVDMFKLLEAALRQRPEYLIVGEVRGREAQTLFQAMATGHATYSTVHADSAASAVHRLENEPIMVPRMMLQTADIIAVQVQGRIGDHLVRRVKEVVEIVGMDPETGDLLTNKVFEWDPATDVYHYFGNSHVLDLTRQKRGMTAEAVEEEWANRTRILRWMVETGIRGIGDVSNVISAYYSQPGSVMENVRAWEAQEDAAATQAATHPTNVKISEQAAARPAFSYATPTDPGSAIAVDDEGPDGSDLEADDRGLFGHPNDPRGDEHATAGPRVHLEEDTAEPGHRTAMRPRIIARKRGAVEADRGASGANEEAGAQAAQDGKEGGSG